MKSLGVCQIWQYDKYVIPYDKQYAEYTNQYAKYDQYDNMQNMQFDMTIYTTWYEVLWTFALFKLHSIPGNLYDQY